LHEAYPVLIGLSVPLVSGALAVIALMWHLLVVRSVEPYFTRPLLYFCVFFALVTAGLPFAIDPSVAFNNWQMGYWKIAVATLAIAWLARTASDFGWAEKIFVLSGCLVAMVAIFNKLNGLGLVEGTRVTIGRPTLPEGVSEFDAPGMFEMSGGVLGDPNDLALVLLFPLAFAVAILIYRSGWLSVFLGAISVPTILLAILYTQSRGGFIGVLAVAGVIGWRLIKSKTLLVGIICALAVALFLAMAIKSRSGDMTESGIDESAMGRLNAWRTATVMAIKRPLTGVGLNNFRDSYYGFAVDVRTRRDIVVHSTWFQVLAEMGFPGFIVFVTMVISTFRAGLRSMSALNTTSHPPAVRAMALALVAGLAGFCAAGSFLTQAFAWPFYMMLALTVALSRYVSEHSVADQAALSDQERSDGKSVAAAL
jgi:hypothetical protein